MRAAGVALLVLLSLAATGAAAGADAGGDRPDGAGPAAVPGTSTCATPAPAGFADPPADVLGWERGTWAGEPLAVGAGNGLSPSELRAVVNRSMARVEAVRCLEFGRDVTVERRTRTAHVNRTRARAVARDRRDVDDALYGVLFLLPESADAAAAARRNRGNATLGFYAVGRDRIVVIAPDDAPTRLSERVLAHELVHALQDQHFDLASHRRRTHDGVAARRALVEGDAKYVALRYANRCDGAWAGTCLRPPPGDGAGGIDALGIFLFKTFPYADGPPFIAELRAEGGWAAVNDRYGAPPATTEQVIHPERLGRDPPTALRPDGDAAAGWERVRPADGPGYETVGEAGLATMFAYPLYDRTVTVRPVRGSDWFNRGPDGTLDRLDPYDYDNRYAAGWDGDRLVVYRDGANRTAVVWRLAWDTPADAGEFAGGYRELLRGHGARRLGPNTSVIDAGRFAGAYHVAVADATVTVTVAPTVGELGEIRPGLRGRLPDPDAPGDAVAVVARSDRGPLSLLAPTRFDPHSAAIVLAVLLVAIAGIGRRLAR